jgi:gliding motility-associated-like protein
MTGCTNSTISAVEIHPFPAGTLTANYWQGCVPLCSEFTFRPGYQSKNLVSTWSFERRTARDAFTNCFTQAGSYQITGTLLDTITRCVSSQTYQVQAYEKPEAAFEWEPQQTTYSFEELTFTSTTPGKDLTHEWYLDDGSMLSGQSVRHSFREAGQYRIVLVSGNQHSCADTVMKLIEIKPEFSFYMPDAFTPNTDDLNETFRPEGTGVNKYQLQIFDRWGERLFLSYDMSQGWDGRYQGQLCKGDAYVWKVVLTTNAGEQKEYQGYVVLVR